MCFVPVLAFITGVVCKRAFFCQSKAFRDLMTLFEKTMFRSITLTVLLFLFSARKQRNICCQHGTLLHNLMYYTSYTPNLVPKFKIPPYVTLFSAFQLFPELNTAPPVQNSMYTHPKKACTDHNFRTAVKYRVKREWAESNTTQLCVTTPIGRLYNMFTLF